MENRFAIPDIAQAAGLALAAVGVAFSATASERQVYGQWNGKIRQLRLLVAAGPGAARAQTDRNIQRDIRKREGSYGYIYILHPWMTGQINVKE